MTFLIAVPDVMQTAAGQLAGIGDALSQANGAAAATTTEITAAGADEVSAAIASVFGSHAQQYQALSAQLETFHQQFVQLMSGGAAQYGLTEAANATPLQTIEQDILNVINAPSLALTGRPLIGNGANGKPGIGANGGDGGWLWGSGGNGGYGSPGHSGGNGGAGGFFGGAGGTGGAGGDGGSSSFNAGGAGGSGGA
ncbi:PE family protein, partial [Mycobacterium sp. 1245805.9]|uniref:PE family protein n=1 Tax=Mycobacterium sp. 1245805.9 TaxID=1856862 RepID=UPI000AF217C5